MDCQPKDSNDGTRAKKSETKGCQLNHYVCLVLLSPADSRSLSHCFYTTTCHYNPVHHIRVWFCPYIPSPLSLRPDRLVFFLPASRSRVAQWNVQIPSDPAAQRDMFGAYDGIGIDWIWSDACIDGLNHSELGWIGLLPCFEDEWMVVDSLASIGQRVVTE